MPRSKDTVSIALVRGEDWLARGRPALIGELGGSLAVVVRGALGEGDRQRWIEGVYRARGEWVSDFEGEQFAVGRAFYTHLETDRSGEYFGDAAASDARVERALPGMQALVRETFARLVGGAVRPRLGFCGPGVHVFPAGGKVARKGGVVHFDVEGLTPHQLARRRRATTVVWMLQPGEWGGGLRVWNAAHHGDEFPSERQLSAARRTIRYGAGDLVLMESARLHQIRPFRGDRDRISITAHAVEVDSGVWEIWF